MSRSQGIFPGLITGEFVQATVEFKWTHWCRNLLWVQLALYLLWVFAFTIFTILFQVSPNAAFESVLPVCVSGASRFANP